MAFAHRHTTARGKRAGCVVCGKDTSAHIRLENRQERVVVRNIKCSRIREGYYGVNLRIGGRNDKSAVLEVNRMAYRAARTVTKCLRTFYIRRPKRRAHPRGSALDPVSRRSSRLVGCYFYRLQHWHNGQCRKKGSHPRHATVPRHGSPLTQRPGCDSGIEVDDEQRAVVSRQCDSAVRLFCRALRRKGAVLRNDIKVGRTVATFHRFV